ncbi:MULTISPECIES: MerR family transcriptional regulator [unclassified Streptomyces]|uniref:MerR family transcriptional regulator n=1 Tax=unclassified Streptomyces TaxID=2593676 RepID=UPI002E15727D|nr:MerR family transcriptional regulator [Streptomyces sp. NBC_01197]WSS50749.1 MerR family transcriptional regulator [Streptomyces sp. NBC_01180]
MSPRPRPYAPLADVTLVTSALAAQEAGVVPATIRKWVQLGHLRPSGRQGRRRLYRLEHVFAAERATRRAQGRRTTAAAPAPRAGPATEHTPAERR